MFDFQSLVSQEKAFCSQCLIVGDVNTLVLTLFSATAHCAERANSPSILEGVPEGRGSNIGLLIPFFIVFVLIIIHNVVSDDFLSAEIETMKHLFVNLFPKRNLGHVADSAIFTRIG